MSSKQTTVDAVVKNMSLAGEVRSLKMFGEYAIYCNDKVVALVCDDTLFVKQTVAGRDYIGSPKEAPPYPGAKNSFLISEKQWQDKAWLTELIRVTVKELPVQKKKSKKKNN